MLQMMFYQEDGNWRDLYFKVLVTQVTVKVQVLRIEGKAWKIMNVTRKDVVKIVNCSG